MISGKLTKKNYFDYLHSLFYSLHKGIYSGKVLKIQKYASGNLYNFTTHVQKYHKNIKKISSPNVIKFVNENNNKKNNNENNNKKIKKSSSNDNIFNSKIIHLIECEQK